ncbi:MAG: site-specific recombinase, partial [Patescibacteria group bacterium]|nr:site-specific recombinase [Patescibacteria group bacterium]
MDNGIKSKTFVYLRRSQDREDRQQLSLSKQDTQVRELINHHKLVPIHLPAEERSAKRPGRPIFNDMMARIEAGEGRYITVWALSRLSRNALDGGKVIDALDTGKLLAIHTPSRTYRNTPDDKMVLAIELAFAKKNNDDLSVQVREGFEEKRVRGQYPGPAPLGYQNAIIRPGERNIAPHPDDGPKVQRLFKEASTGQKTLQDLWELAFDMGLKSRAGNRLSKNTLNDLLKRKAYAGLFKYGGEDWTKGTYEPLITMDLYDAVQVAMGWKHQTRRAHTAKRNYPYKGVLLCQKCSFNVTAYTKVKVLASGDRGEYVYYVCTHKNKRIECKEPQVVAADLESEIATNLQDYELTARQSQKCLEYIQQFYEERVGQRNQYAAVWKKDYSVATERIAALDEALEARAIAPEHYKERVAKHETMQARTTQLLEESSHNAEAWLELAKEVFTSTVDISSSFEHANDAER